jgi:hypothetical protein
MVENQIARPIVELNDICIDCHATGKQYKERWELCELLWDMHKRQRAGFCEMIAVYRQWRKDDGYIDCPECGGEGSFLRLK